MSITPERNTIMKLFSSNKQYYLDFYQRDYQWKREHVDKLLEDIFYRFSLEYKKDLDVNQEVVSEFDWYYLNAYVTNDYKGKTFIVDGQQRLTTLTLILIKLYHMAKEYNSTRVDVVKEQIMGAGLDGHTYWMGQGLRKIILEDIFKHQEKTIEYEEDDVSIKHMYDNYKTIDRLLEQFIQNFHMLDTFILYFLIRVQLVNIQIQETKDVPMVFEVINDRGERLKPYEVLKGKLLGQIDKNEIDPYYNIWQEHIHALQLISDREVDDFFRFYFRAKYVDNRADWRDFDGEYHKVIYEEKWDNKIHLKHNPTGVKSFITQDLDYYASLYLKIRNGSNNPAKYPYLYFNSLNDQDRQYLLILSACQTNDPDEAEKIDLISRLFDRYFSLLQLTGSYDSNRFTKSLTELNKNMRNKSLDEISTIMTQHLLADISDAKETEVSTPFVWGYFSTAGTSLNYRFTKYFFARIDHFIAENSTEETAQSYYNLVSKIGPKNGYHIEHILAHNDENMALFGDDEDMFNQERNRLGAILLLQGKDNIASKNEPYREKLKIYKTRQVLWNKTLSGDFYHKNPAFREFAKRNKLNFKPYEIFDGTAVEERQRLLFDIIQIIWA
jgi:uncharacterized protein with ParB-like and HNH nuclease domain